MDRVGVYEVSSLEESGAWEVPNADRENELQSLLKDADEWWFRGGVRAMATVTGSSPPIQVHRIGT